MRIVLFGPQGSGKGTQAPLLQAHLGVPHLSTGDLFRAEIAAGTPLGRQASAALTAGELVPDAIAQAMLADRLRKSDTRHGFVLDGFPRTPEQADWLDAMLVGGPGLDAVVLLTAPQDVLVARAIARGLADDTPAAIDRRLAVYTERTEPLLAFYGDLVLEVDGNRPAQLVHQDILAGLHSRTPVG